VHLCFLEYWPAAPPSFKLSPILRSPGDVFVLVVFLTSRESCCFFSFPPFSPELAPVPPVFYERTTPNPLPGNSIFCYLMSCSSLWWRPCFLFPHLFISQVFLGLFPFSCWYVMSAGLNSAFLSFLNRAPAPTFDSSLPN